MTEKFIIRVCQLVIMGFVLIAEVCQLLTFMMRGFLGGDSYEYHYKGSGQCRLAIQHFWRPSSLQNLRTTKTQSNMHNDLH